MMYIFYNVKHIQFRTNLVSDYGGWLQCSRGTRVQWNSENLSVKLSPAQDFEILKYTNV
jgi:hypothetical protein